MAVVAGHQLLICALLAYLGIEFFFDIEIDNCINAFGIFLKALPIIDIKAISQLLNKPNAENGEADPKKDDWTCCLIIERVVL